MKFKNTSWVIELYRGDISIFRSTTGDYSVPVTSVIDDNLTVAPCGVYVWLTDEIVTSAEFYFYLHEEETCYIVDVFEFYSLPVGASNLLPRINNV